MGYLIVKHLSIAWGFTIEMANSLGDSIDLVTQYV